jgi:hypothetical protein
MSQSTETQNNEKVKGILDEAWRVADQGTPYLTLDRH